MCPKKKKEKFTMNEVSFYVLCIYNIYTYIKTQSDVFSTQVMIMILTMMVSIAGIDDVARYFFFFSLTTTE